MVRIDRLSADEWERARAIRLRALDDAPDAFWSTAEQERADPPATWRARLARTSTATFVAADTATGADVGLVVGATHHEAETDAGLFSMWVAAEARGRGIGRQLVAAVLEWARAGGYRRVRLDVGDHNVGAVALYGQMGFVPTGVTDRFPAPRDHVVEHERVVDLDG